MYLDKIQEKRNAQKQLSEEKRKELLSVALSKGVKNQVSASSKDSQQALVAAVGVLVRFLKEHEPNVTVKNPTTFPTSISTPDIKPVVDAIKVLIEKVNNLPTKYPDFPKFPDYPDFPKSITISNLSELKPWLQKVEETTKNIKLSPVINVAPTPVTIPKVDLTPIVDALKTPKTLDLNDYKAQDLAEDDTTQWIGFVAPDGSWYIAENDYQASSIRYKFGSKNYPTAWKNYNGHTFRRLNEAIREVQT